MRTFGWALLPLAVAMFASALAQPEDPYVVLGLKRSASARDIKQAYKRLVKEWHPDKNNSPQASDRFMAIAQAYEILSDPTKKERFDRYGAYDTHPQKDHHHGGYHHGGFDDIFNYAFGGGRGGGGSGGSNAFDKHRITYRMYVNSLLEKSHTQPFIIYAYSTYCHVCYVLEPIWKEAVADLESLGYGVGTVNYLTDSNLMEKLRVSYLPAICVLVEGRVVHYRAPMNALSAKAIRLFARDAIPTTFLHRLNHYDALRRFLDQWESTNKPSILIVGAREEPRLRYSLLAMRFSHFARFAYVDGSSALHEIREMRTALGVQCANCENIFVFDETPETGPVAKLTADQRQFTTEEMTALVNKHKLLRLPRISSTPIFDELCPVSSRSLKHLCVVLPVVSGGEDAGLVANLRRFVASHGESLIRERIRIAVVFVDRQPDFMVEFREPKAADPAGGKRNVLVLWRYEYTTAKFAWLPHIWSADTDTMHKCFEELNSRVYALARGTPMIGTAKIISLVDEYAPSWFTRVSRRVVRVVETIWYHATKEELLPILSVAGTLFFIFLIGYGLNYIVNENHGGVKPQRFENARYSTSTASSMMAGGSDAKEWHPEDPRTPPVFKPTATAAGDGEKAQEKTDASRKSRMWREMEPMLHELRAETYFGLIRLLKPGCRSIIILVDDESKDVLLPKFAKHIYSLRNNKTFSFGYLMVNKNLEFFRSLLEHTLPDANDDGEAANDGGADELTAASPTQDEGVAARAGGSGLSKSRLKCINPKQTLGTVLVICGWKLYFSMYHPMHTANKAKSSDPESSSDSGGAGHRLHGPKEKMLKKGLNLENVLNRLPNFLDRLIEGSIRRYYIPEWPENLT